MQYNIKCDARDIISDISAATPLQGIFIVIITDFIVKSFHWKFFLPKK